MRHDSSAEDESDSDSSDDFDEKRPIITKFLADQISLIPAVDTFARDEFKDAHCDFGEIRSVGSGPMIKLRPFKYYRTLSSQIPQPEDKMNNYAGTMRGKKKKGKI